VNLGGQRYTIWMGVHTLGGYSAHADQQDLVNFVARMWVKPRQVILVYGAARAKAALAGVLQQRMAGLEVSIP
jgi:metallo-beta-lactamase family protein